MEYSVRVLNKAVRRAPIVVAALVIGQLATFCPRSSHASEPSPNAVAEARAADKPADSAPAGRDSGRAARTLGWISLAVGAEAAVVAVVTSVLLLQQKGVRDDNCDANKVCSQHGLDANSSIGSLVPWNTASWIVAAAGVGTGAILLLTHRSDRGAHTAVAVLANPAGVGVGLWRTF